MQKFNAEKTKLMLELEALDWHFIAFSSDGIDDGAVWMYKSPRMSIFDFFPEYTETKDDAFYLERNFFGQQLSNAIDEIYFLWRNKVIKDYIIELQNGGNPKKELVININETAKVQ